MERRCYGCMKMVSRPYCQDCGWTMDSNNETHQLPVGTVLEGKYIVGRVLGQGGFGITYLGWDQNLDIQICIKEFFPSFIINRNNTYSNMVFCNTKAMEKNYVATRERFMREAKTLAKFRSTRQIVDIYDFFIANNTAYMVMEYVNGIDLAKYVASNQGKLKIAEVLHILKPIMEALCVVHKTGAIHRDISPDNIMLHPVDGAKLLDFGAVRMVENPDADKELTHSTEAILKHGFAPMEQYLGRGSLGPWTDVYALCATIYYCITGRVPPQAPARIMEEESLDWSGALDISAEQIEILERGMSPLIKNRIPSVNELMVLLYEESQVVPQFTQQKQEDTSEIGKTEPISKSTSRISSSNSEHEPEVVTKKSDSMPIPTRNRRPWPIIAICGVAVLAVLFLVLMLTQDDKAVPSDPDHDSVPPAVSTEETPALEHNWVPGTCVELEHCTICGQERGELLPHSWTDGSEQNPPSCTMCGKSAEAIMSFVDTAGVWINDEYFPCEYWSVDDKSIACRCDTEWFINSKIVFYEPNGYKEIKGNIFSIEKNPNTNTITFRLEDDLEKGCYNFALRNPADLNEYIWGTIFYGYPSIAYPETDVGYNANVQLVHWKTGRRIIIDETEISAQVLDRGKVFESTKNIVGVAFGTDGVPRLSVQADNVGWVRTNYYLHGNQSELATLSFQGWYLTTDESGQVYLTKEMSENCFWVLEYTWQ